MRKVTDSPEAVPEAVSEAIPVDEVPVAAPAAATSTVEVWARAKGMLPELVPGPTPPTKGARPRLVGNPEHWKFAAARAGERWPEGKELTEAEFDAAVDKAATHSFR